MDLYLVLLVPCALARVCDKTRTLEVGAWRHYLQHMDSAVVENKPVSMSEGQVYVYENYFPGHTIKYIHVDNLAVRTCGASATIKAGGVGTSTVLIVLHADTNQEIRSVVDIWGERNDHVTIRPKPAAPKNMKSVYLNKGSKDFKRNMGFVFL